MSDDEDYLEKLTKQEIDEIDELLEKAFEAKQFVNSMLEHTGLLATATAKVRVKDKVSLARKICEKRETNKDYSLSDVTDILGVRLVTPFQSPELIRLAIKVFRDENVGYSPFKNKSLREIIFYFESTAQSHNNISVVLKDEVHALTDDGVKVLARERHDLYSGCHIIGDVFVSSKAEETLPVEVQIRSVFEDIWADLSHNIYEITRVKTKSGVYISPKLKERIEVLKNHMDAVAKHANLIHKDVLEYIDSGTRAKKETPVKRELNSSSDIRVIFDHFSIDFVVRDKYLDLLKEKKKLDKKFENPNSKNEHENYSIIANRFLSLFTEESASRGYLASKKGKDGAYSEAQLAFLYYVRMEEALCRLFANTDDELEKAKSIYVDLKSYFPNGATLSFRLGQVYVQLEEFDSAIKEYKNSIAFLEKLKDLPVTERYIELTDVQKDYLLRTQARLLSFTYWWRAREQLEKEGGPLEKVLEGYIKAYQYARDGIDNIEDEEARNRLLNSCVYFGAEVIAFKNNHCSNTESLDREEFTQLVEKLQNVVNPDDPDQLKSIDTLSYAFDVLEKNDVAVHMAFRVLDKIKKVLGKNSHPGAEIIDYSKKYSEELLAMVQERALSIIQKQESRLRQ